MLPRLLAAALLLAASGCTADADETPGHTHTGDALVSLPVGDGTEAERVGYELVGARIDGAAGRTAEVSFRIHTFRGRPLTDYIEELTRDLHLYVVRDDLEVFRHLHPTMADDGTWRAPVTLPAAGDYRVIAEFVARDEGGNGDHLILGDTVPVAGPAGGTTPLDPVVQVEVGRSPDVGTDGRMELTVRDDRDLPVRLGTYLGTYGHVTGFHRDTGAVVHMHPLGAPEVTEDGATLSFHTEIPDAGDYRLFVQVRVDGYLHTVPVEVAVADPA